MLYKYVATTIDGEKQSGSIEAPSIEIAINSLQSHNLIIISINPAEKSGGIFEAGLFSEHVKNSDIVIFSRQLATLFEAKVSVVESFKLLANESGNAVLRKRLTLVIGDIKGGSSISQALAKHPDLFSKFYVNMVKAGEEAGKLEEIFSYLADYLERFFELTSKTKRALVYPAFVLGIFIVVISLMMVLVIPKLTSILFEVGQTIPLYTRIIIGISNFFRNFGAFILLAIAGSIVFLWKYNKTKEGKIAISRFQFSLPYIGDLYKKFYLSRITDSLETTLSSGIPLVRSLEIAVDVVGSGIYRDILLNAIEEVRGGNPLSSAFVKYEYMPSLVCQMIKIGEESGKLNFMLKTLSRFYKREVDNSIETLVSLIEPALIIVLGAGIGILLIGILGPIYNIASGM